MLVGMIESKRNPRSSCPVACGLDVLGDKWTLLIIRDLLLSNRCEFGHLLNAGEGISTNILTDRLAKMQADGLIKKTKHPEHGKKYIYALSDKGVSLAPMMMELALWADKHVEGAALPKVLADFLKQDRTAAVSKLMKGEFKYKFDLS